MNQLAPMFQLGSIAIFSMLGLQMQPFISKFTFILGLIILKMYGGNVYAISEIDVRSAYLSVDDYPYSIKPRSQHPIEIQYIVRLISAYHIHQPKIDDELSSRFYDEFLQRLDPNKVYFTRGNIEDFEILRFQLDELIKAGNLHPLYQVYNAAHQRKKERFAYSKAMLAKLLKVNKGVYPPESKSEIDWSLSKAKLKERWEAMIASDVKELISSVNSVQEVNHILTNQFESSLNEIESFNSNDVFAIIVNSLGEAVDSRTEYSSYKQLVEESHSKNSSIGIFLRNKGLFAEIDSIVENISVLEPSTIEIGDKIIKVAEKGKAGVNVIGWKADDIAKLLLGKEGTEVTLTLIRNKLSKIVEVNVSRMSGDTGLPKVAHRLIEKKGRAVGVISIPEFYFDFKARYNKESEFRSASRDIGNILKEVSFQQADGYVIDLRNNEGGAVIEGLETASYFLGKKNLFKERNFRNVIKDNMLTSDAVVSAKPLVVLVNQNTGGASEILAAAIQDYGIGIIVGSKTHGMGTLQQSVETIHHLNFNENSQPGSLTLAIAEVYRVDGRSIHNVGVIPDIQLPLDGSELSDSKATFERAETNSLPIEYTHIESTNLTPLIKRIKSKVLKKKTASIDYTDEEQGINKSIEIVLEWLSAGENK